MKDALSKREKQTLHKLCGPEFETSAVAANDILKGFYAHRPLPGRPICFKDAYGAHYRLEWRTATAYYHKYTEVKDELGNVLHTNKGPFYWGTIYTRGEARGRYKKVWRQCEYEKHFISAKTWLEFKEAFTEALGKDYYGKTNT